LERRGRKSFGWSDSLTVAERSITGWARQIAAGQDEMAMVMDWICGLVLILWIEW
jgi:hypothetical protein